MQLWGPTKKMSIQFGWKNSAPDYFKRDNPGEAIESEGFIREFLNNNQWYAIRIGVAMKDRIKYIAAYQSAQISAVTCIAKIKEIKPYQDSGKYLVIFDGPAEEIKPTKKVVDSNKSPQGPVYVKREKLLGSKSLDEAIDYEQFG